MAFPIRATIVITPRERHSLSAETLRLLLAVTDERFSLVYVDVCSPPPIQAAIEAICVSAGAHYVRFDEWVSPTEARRSAMRHVATEYVVYLDNDVLVHPGWLNALIACADETRAGIVGPLYLEADGVNTPRVHMAGGVFAEVRSGDERSLVDNHRHESAELTVAAELKPGPCDFVEYHCFLAKSALMAAPAAFDDSISTVHDHLDLALTARAGGERVYFTPKSVVTYLGSADYAMADLEIFSRRWDYAEAERSLARFGEKWALTETDPSFVRVRAFIKAHRAAIEPLDASLPRHDRSDAGPVRLAQTRTELLAQAVRRGYDEPAVAKLATAWVLAMQLANGLYRPCGRPFLDHAVGTASALLLDGCAMPVVVAGLLHSAYTHASGRFTEQKVSEMLGGRGSLLDRLVRAHSARDASRDDQDGPLAELSLETVKAVMIGAANVVDMRLSGEISASGRPDPLTTARQERSRLICQAVGANRLAVLLAAPVSSATSIPALGVQQSFRVDADRDTVQPVTTTPPGAQGPAGVHALRIAIEEEIERRLLARRVETAT